MHLTMFVSSVTVMESVSWSAGNVDESLCEDDVAGLDEDLTAWMTYLTT